MDDEIQLISDGDGIAVIGEARAVERFLSSEGLPSRELGLQRLGPTLAAAAASVQVGSEVAAHAGRWVELTEQSARMAKSVGLMTNSESGLSMGVIYARGQAQGIKGIVQFAKGPGAFAVTNPAVLAGAAGIMAQFAMQQTMDEITDYLATIDEKVDDVLRGQKDAALAQMIGVDFVIEEAMTIRQQVGRVSDVTWSKVQATTATIAQTQAYALRQLDALAEKVDSKAKLGDLAKSAKEAETTVREWLAVLARCFQLQDAVAEAQNYRDLQKGTLKIGVPPLIASFLFPGILSAFTAQYPNLQISIIEDGSKKLRQFLEQGQLDLAIVNLHQAPPLLETLPLSREQFVVCLPTGHRLAGQAAIDLTELQEEPFILFTEDAYNRLAVLQACEAKGFSPKILLSSSQVETHKALVAKGVGISFLLEKIVAQSKGLVACPLTEPIYLEFGLAWKKERYLSRASQAFIDFVVAATNNPND